MKFFKFLFLLIIISCNGQSENNKQKETIKKEITKNDVYYAKCTSNLLSTGQKIQEGDNWNLNKRDVEEILKLSSEIDENEWHFSYPITPCNIEIKNYLYKGEKYDLQINGGSYVSLFDGKKTMILGCDSPQCSKFFLLPKENMEESENDIENNSNSKKYEVDFNKDGISDLLIIKKNNSAYTLEIEQSHKPLFTKIFNCDSFDIDTNVKNKQIFNLKFEYVDQYQKVFRKVVIPVFYERNIFLVKKIFIANFGISAKTGNNEWQTKEVLVDSSLEKLDLDVIVSK